ncbi:MAG: bidirectional hydrogenase complex protein HoxU [Armatimonadota bacterium]|nr:bidirectional hydrogenase complex protein HoxU [Armatimonadota bacterium]MDR7537175.1 bidirectional hydrogenase complex protein HoxU [Armatimonadota bacterium]
MTVRTLVIDGEPVGARDGETILEAAREHGIVIPTLCYLEGLSAVGACRLCLVEVAGAPRPLAACVTRVAEGMEVTTDAPRVRAYRRMILELLFAEGNHVCAVCVANGHCDLQALAAAQGMTHVRYPYRAPLRGVDASHERFVLDHNRCILCTRCVRACDEVEGAHTWDVAGRGATSRVIADLDQPWGTSDTCTSCGKCVQVCPTGALVEKGRGPGEMIKRPEFLPYITTAREARRWIR